MSEAMVLPIPALNLAGSLEQYIQTVSRFPLLSAEEETELGRRLRDSNDLNAAQQLILSHLRLVVSIARQYSGYGLPQADLIQEGNVGLMKAVRRFDPERGVRLVSFAIHWIKAEIHEYVLKNWRLVKIATTKAQRKLFFGLRSLKPGFGSLSAQETAEVAKQLGVRPEDVSEMEMRLSGQDISLEPQEDSDEQFAPISYLADDALEPVEQISQREQDKLSGEGLSNALAALDERSRRIITARWLQADDKEAATLHDLADEFGVSAERIRQIEQRAMAKLKSSLTTIH
ncbi:RNA polymerase sigma factor RpoH [Ferrovum sp. PN-J185]|uniref:RNA polymerase sigma factor RpoH n=1 Tax=Ferrovum sp. PN-J185 TaxID=1356306 RepID=UPI00079147DD|nr:RNA polymerase sigma factor RpoH [Ferrovum sp. PN-J185]KXW55646.1 RNA polymerase sigma factor RpoH [Ferrovum sp. PN-J185]MCC6068851.1 RNA polymerase sigma factor RpoH [Ferrovum sp. PN-J185]MDE1891143.1 RNA polymerase sigma factor RpoH [Betaproteobacteria bacterium]MDE2056183.1 RNA polymerase sigma factor RpoH [Betaproteobacteria bacterium]